MLIFSEKTFSIIQKTFYKLTKNFIIMNDFLINIKDQPFLISILSQGFNYSMNDYSKNIKFFLNFIFQRKVNLFKDFIIFIL